MVIELLLFLLLMVVLKLLRTESKSEKMYKKLPGPKSYPMVGNLFEFYFPRKDFAKTIKKMSFEYGPVYLMKLGTEHFVCLRNPDDVEVVLSNTRVIDKAPLYELLQPWFKEGLFTCSGETWTKQRKILSPAFNLKVLESFLPVFEKNAKVFVNNLIKASINGKEFDVMPLASPCSVDIVCETAMGLEVNAQLGKSPYLEAVEELSEIIAHRGTSIIERTFLFHTLPSGRRHNKLISYLHGITDRMILERKEKLSALQTCDIVGDKDDDIGIRRKIPFLDLLLEYNKEGAGMSESEIRMQVDTFMGAGYDTVQSTTSFALYCLSQNEDIQDKVYEETKEIFGESDRDATYQDLQEMKYLEKVIKETLRLHPAAQFLARLTKEDLELKSGYTIPKNSSVMILMEAMNHDPELFPEPLKFNPDRFDQKYHPYAFIPFGGGIRNCIGQRYAMLELKSVLSRVVRKLRLLPSSIPIVTRYDLVLRSTTGINLRVEPRDTRRG